MEEPSPVADTARVLPTLAPAAESAPAQPAFPPAAAPAPAASQPAWQVVQPQPAAAPTTDGGAARRAHAEWFVWAQRQGMTPGESHAVAGAAIVALAAGADAQTAAATAVQSRGRDASPAADVAGYCAWFAVAAVDMGLDSGVAHRFAEAGFAAVSAGHPLVDATIAAELAAGLRKR